MWQFKSVTPWARRLATRGLLLAGTATLLASLAAVPTASAQIVISVNPPVCSYGYYDYAPYGCAPSGFYGPGYFFDGIFLGVGPWSNWGYNHGWGGHRFSNAGGGRYVAGQRDGGGRGGARVVNANHSTGYRAAPARSGGVAHAAATHSSPSRASTSRASAGHGGASRASAPHATAGGGSHGGGEARGGGEKR